MAHECAISTSRCVNTVGGYQCECFPGYKQGKKPTLCHGERSIRCTYISYFIYNFLFWVTQLLLAIEFQTRPSNPRSIRQRFPSSPALRNTLIIRHDISSVNFFLPIFCLKDIDECVQEKPVCEDQMRCMNTHGSYKCLCKRDYFKITSTICLVKPSLTITYLVSFILLIGSIVLLVSSTLRASGKVSNFFF